MPDTPERRQVSPFTYLHSKPLPAEIYESADLPTRFRPRISKHTHVAVKATWECRDDLPAPVDTVGAISSVGHLVSIVYPETSPERIHMIAYNFEYAFLHDDQAEKAKAGEDYSDVNRSAWTFGGRDEQDTGSPKTKSLQARMVCALLDIDEELAKPIFDTWYRWLSVDPKDLEKQYKSFDEYIDVRREDAGFPCYISLIFYTSNVALSREERISVEPIIKACGTPMFLTNDYYSWDKEYRVWVSGGKSTYLINAVHVLINLHSLDATKAKNLLRSKILDAEQVYCDLRDQYMKDCAPGPQVTRFFELLELGIAGNCLFHAKSARYDPSIPVPIRNSEKELPLNSGTSHSHARLDTPIDNTESPKTSTTAESVSTREWTTSNLQDAKPADEKERIQEEAVVRNGIEYLTDQIALEPFAYTSSLPEKGARNTLIDALENYYEVPSAPLFKIREIVAAIHNVSLMLDDIQDGSPSRRGYPSSHMVFGISQTVNSATYAYAKCLENVMKLSKAAAEAFSSEICQLHIGQSYDLHWTFHCKAPSIDEYMKQLEKKTGGLFRMAARMMQAEATKNQSLNMEQLMNLFGRYFQLRDDYQDLSSSSSSTEFDDLDQGSFTMPIIHALAHQEKQGTTRLLSTLQMHKQSKSQTMSTDMKKLIIDDINKAGSLEFAKGVLGGLYEDVLNELEVVEKRAGIENWILKLLLYRLKI